VGVFSQPRRADDSSPHNPHIHTTVYNHLLAHTIQAGVEGVRAELVEERVQELRRCEETLKAVAADGACAYQYQLLYLNAEMCFVAA
jgi:hypothetical protein